MRVRVGSQQCVFTSSLPRRVITSLTGGLQVARSVVLLTLTALAVSACGVLGGNPSPSPGSSPGSPTKRVPVITCAYGLPDLGGDTCPSDPTKVPDPTDGSFGQRSPLNTDPASSRIHQLLPVFNDQDQLDDSQAFAYIKRAAALLRKASLAFKATSAIIDCEIKEGAVAARVYVSKDLSSATAMAIVSKRQAGSLPLLLGQCAYNSVTGGGPSTNPFDPCEVHYYFDALFPATSQSPAVTHIFYVFVVSTSGARCDAMFASHARFARYGVDGMRCPLPIVVPITRSIMD